MSSQSFARIGPYTLLGTLAEGGMGRVFLAHRDGAAEVCVLKQLHVELESHPTASRRLQREALIASTLNHPNIARILESGSDDGGFYIAMEFIAGQTLAELLVVSRERGSPIPPRVAIAIIVSVLHGLEYAHELKLDDGAQLGFVHRDVTPRNIMIAYEGDVKIIDFGIARAHVLDDDFRTSPGVVLGTLTHMAPEQALALDVDRRSDLYSIGTILYELLSQRPVVVPGTPKETIQRIVSESPPPLRSLNPSLPERLDQVIAKAIAKKPDARHQNARELRDALAECCPDLPDRAELSRLMHELFAREERETRWLMDAAGSLRLRHRSASAETIEDRLERLLERASSSADPTMWSLDETDPEMHFGDDPTVLVPELANRLPARNVADEIRKLESNGVIELSLSELPFDEVLLSLHETRFTGTLDIGGLPEIDRLFFRLGAVVGISPNRELDADLFQRALLELELIPPLALENVSRKLKHLDAPLLGSYLKERGLIAEEQLERARTEQNLRRLFLLFDRIDVGARLVEGIRHLDELIPTYTDILPVIAYGMIVRSDPSRRWQLAKRIEKQRVRLIAPYDEERNRYGLPPKILEAIRLLPDGIDFDAEPVLGNLDSATTLGVLLLLERIALLAIEEHDTLDLPLMQEQRRTSSS